MVLPHGPLQQLDDDLWLVEGEIPRLPIGRKMVVARLATGGLFVHNAMMLDEPTTRALEALGEVAYVFVPNAFHDIDGGRMKARHPRARLCALPAVHAKLVKKFPDLEVLDPATLPAPVTLRPVPGVKGDEPVMEVASRGGVTLVYTDALFNLGRRPGIAGLVLRAIGSAGSLRMTRVEKLFMLHDRGAFVAHLREQAARRDVTRVIVAHGDVIDRDVPAAFEGAIAAM